MGKKGSAMEYRSMKIYEVFIVAFMLIWATRVSRAVTNPDDVAAINALYIAMGSPVLPGWVGSGGDPCAEGWQGVQCNEFLMVLIWEDS
ncbi:protein STRUBBELIG-RECEPTOR FAMILY 3-like isoform X2 [Carica papaya]|uniref:protein STRUBBELIG-RECEPTOR FAMILY 3-like isoform X2 n=1 Tax=Carica papaya TaxID=3649 RepID=UPI000B8CE932|nr:protein STRUBBELIG-RECEPTOR FAMILY 3-like isoform X2 [Carica papaya]